MVTLSNSLCNENNFIKLTIGNPKEFNSYVLDGYVNGTNSWGEYSSSQSGNTKYIDLYVGENPDTGITYQNFFQMSNIALTEENVLLFRPLILIYGGYRKIGKPNTKVEFVKYLKTNILDKVTTNTEAGWRKQ